MKYKGVCNICKKTISRNKFKNHINKCIEQYQFSNYCLLHIQDTTKIYWMYILVPQNFELTDLDDVVLIYYSLNVLLKHFSFLPAYLFLLIGDNFSSSDSSIV